MFIGRNGLESLRNANLTNKIEKRFYVSITSANFSFQLYIQELIVICSSFPKSSSSTLLADKVKKLVFYYQ